jgi:acetyl-CoA carboxylase carboxyl transferase subunit alpha
MGITADRLLSLGLVDEVLVEPLGSAHRDSDAMMQSLKNALISHLSDLDALDANELVARRANRLESMGRFKEA